MNNERQSVKRRQVFEYHPVIAFRFIPGIKARIPHDEAGGYLIEVNEMGFRSKHTFAAQKPAGIRRILLFGDSFTAGDGVSNGKRFGDLLEQSLPDLEVYNFGLPGTGTDQQYLTFQTFAKDFDYDLLVLTIFVENIRRVAAHYRFVINEAGEKIIQSKPYYELQNGQLILNNVPVEKNPIQPEHLRKDQAAFVDSGLPLKRLVRRIDRLSGRDWGTKMTAWLSRMGLLNPLKRGLSIQPIPEYNRADHPAWVTMRAILEEWIKCQAKPVLLVLLPLPAHVTGKASSAAFQARFQELGQTVGSGCRVYDLLPELRALPAEDRARLYYREGHLNGYGHAVVANLLTPVVEQMLSSTWRTNE